MRSFIFIQLTEQQHSFKNQICADSWVNSVTVWGFAFFFSSWLCFGFVFFCFKACLQQIQQNRLKSRNNYYAIESSLHYLAHCIAISNSISSFQSIHSQKGCSFCSLFNCYNINPEVTYLYL